MSSTGTRRSNGGHMMRFFITHQSKMEIVVLTLLVQYNEWRLRRDHRFLRSLLELLRPQNRCAARWWVWSVDCSDSTRNRCFNASMTIVRSTPRACGQYCSENVSLFIVVGCSKALLTARYGSTVRRLKLSARQARMITLLESQQGRFRRRWMKHCRAIAAAYLEIFKRSQVAVPRRSM